MSRPRLQLLERGRELLHRLRADHDAWLLLIPRPIDHVRDDHAGNRMQLAWALQYDARPDDARLIRFALEQETAWRAVDPSQGVGETLEIVGWLVARDRRVEDVWLLARAKMANFDAACAFDREHLFAAGVEATIVHVSECERADKDEILGLLLDEPGAAVYTEEEIDAWLAGKAQYFARAPEQESVECWLERAFAVGATELAKELLAEWKNGRARNAAFFRSLAFYSEQLQDYAAVAEARSSLLEHEGDRFTRAAVLCDLAKAERRAGRPERALAALEQAALLHKAAPDWRGIGLGRFFVQECFEVAAACQPAEAQRAFRLGDSFARDTPRLPLVALEAGIHAAHRAGDRVSAQSYRRLTTQERARLTA